MKKTFALLLVLLLAAACFVAGYGYGRWYGPGAPGWRSAEKHAEKRGYHCPMHPHVKSDKPGDCPICGMRMVPDDNPAAPQPQGRVLYYQDPRSPAYRSDKPGLNPETGNELQPIYEQANPGLVMIPAEKRQWIGLKTGLAEVRPATEALRVPGRVAVDETRIIRVQTRFEGWIEKVNVDFTGRLVQKGEPLLTLYSPELVASQQEYLLALKAKETLAHSPVPGVSHSNSSLADAARLRLEHHWGMTPAAIAQLEKTGQPLHATTLASPETGFVIERKAFASQMAKPDMDLYTLADLSHVWIIADIFESDAARIRLGQAAVVEPAHAPGRRFRARVTNILPQIDSQTRTLKVRLEADNPDFALRPDQFMNVEFTLGGAARLSVPEDAVIDTGKMQVVYIDLGEGKFEPRKVEAGERYDGRVEILSGLKPGERIVISGAFLIDSESRMRSGAK
ncbi:MAG: efflux RND transporter periplasmic adaptor subunit [Candidatus Solibacter usitatus]|nr:efflux RND transporter periplasmic adaptor subunit [Candidatus Solibacter usitatus]